MAAHPHLQKRPQPSFQVRRAAGGDHDEAARFLTDHLADLVVLARRHGFDTLAYLLDMAKLEADDMVRRGSGNRSAGL